MEEKESRSRQREKLIYQRVIRPQPKPWATLELGRPFRIDQAGAKEQRLCNSANINHWMVAALRRQDDFGQGSSPSSQRQIWAMYHNPPYTTYKKEGLLNLNIRFLPLYILFSEDLTLLLFCLLKYTTKGQQEGVFHDGIVLNPNLGAGYKI